MLLIPILLVLVAAILIALLLQATKKKVFQFNGKTVLITGASLGIGFELSKQVLEKNASTIILVARNIDNLEKAKQNLKQFAKSHQTIHIISCDASKKEHVKQSLDQITKDIGICNIDVLLLNHGTAVPGYFLEQDESVFESMMQTNYMGHVYFLKTFLPLMLKNASKENPKHVCVVGSTLSLAAIVGYSAYCPSKYALKGLVQALQNEFTGHHIYFHIALPTDVQTPGYEEENKTKPIETVKISEADSFIATASAVAKTILQGIEKNVFYISNALDIRLLATATAGIGPRDYNFVLQFAIHLLMSMLGPFIHKKQNSIVLAYTAQRNERFKPLTS